MPSLFTAATQTLQQAAAPTPDLTATARPLDAQQQAQARQALEQLRTALAQAELPEAPLQALAQLLPALMLEPLQRAIDDFDFDQAQRCLDTLRVQLAPATEEVTP